MITRKSGGRHLRVLDKDTIKLWRTRDADPESGILQEARRERLIIDTKYAPSK
jgi:hypothetical protein